MNLQKGNKWLKQLLRRTKRTFSKTAAIFPSSVIKIVERNMPL